MEAAEQGTWRDEFRALFEERGYEMRSCDYDPAYGWTILFAPLGGGRDAEQEIEMRTTGAVRARIKRLPSLKQAPPTLTGSGFIDYAVKVLDDAQDNLRDLRQCALEARMDVDGPTEALEAAIRHASPSSRWISIPHEQWRGLLAAIPHDPELQPMGREKEGVGERGFSVSIRLGEKMETRDEIAHALGHILHTRNDVKWSRARIEDAEQGLVYNRQGEGVGTWEVVGGG